MDFFIFLLVNATLFIRPGEVIPAMEGWPIYNYIILTNLLIAAPAVINQLSEKNLLQSPITVCVLSVWGSMIVSQLARADFENAWTYGFEFAKVVAYFLLLVGVVNTSWRLAILLGALVVFTLVLNIIAVLHFHGFIHVRSILMIAEEGFETPRMNATGIFGDPNDLSMIIVAALIICAAGLFCRQLGVFRFVLAAPLAFFFYCLTLTQSRGGMLALAAGCGVVCYSWLGLIRACALGVIGLPVVQMGSGSRQLDIGGALSSRGTGNARVEMWSSGLEMLKESPIFGMGSGSYSDYAGQVAHNSFVHAFAELGLLGGTMFLGVFALAAWTLWSLRLARRQILYPGLANLRPFLLAVVVAYCVSMMSLSRCYEVPTYMIPGLAVCYDRLARPGTSLAPLQFNGNVLKWLVVCGVSFVVTIHLYIKIFFR